MVTGGYIMKGFYEWARDLNSQELSRFSLVLKFPEHFHRCQELIRCDEESFEIFLNEKKYTIYRGEYILVHSFTPHLILDTGINTCYIIPVKYSNDYLQKVEHFQPVDPIIRGENAKALDQILALYDLTVQTRDVNTHSGRSEIASAGWTNLLLGKLLEIIPFAELPPKITESRNILIETDRYVRAHYREHIDLDILAKHCGYSKSYYSSAINSILHTNLNKYINTYRVHRFIYHYDPKLPIDYQAEAMGFPSKQTFYRAFNEVCGCSPTEYFK